VASGNHRTRLGEYNRHLRFQGRIPGDRRQLTKLLAQHDPHVYPGRYVTCVHNPDRALCHNGNQNDPSLGDCQPLACRNVALTDENLSAWRHHCPKWIVHSTVTMCWPPASNGAPSPRKSIFLNTLSIWHGLSVLLHEVSQPSGVSGCSHAGGTDRHVTQISRGWFTQDGDTAAAALDHDESRGGEPF
jgi:hypothetical protein